MGPVEVITSVEGPHGKPADADRFMRERKNMITTDKLQSILKKDLEETVEARLFGCKEGRGALPGRRHRYS